MGWYTDLWREAMHNFAGLFVLVVAHFFALALVAGALGMLMQGYAFVRDAFVDGWRKAGEDDSPS